jgi:hypothetical protein
MSFNPRKYVIIEQNDIETVILFDSVLEHITFQKPEWEIVSAGFYRVDVVDDKLHVSCYGNSVSLGKSSRGEEDELLIEKHFTRNLEGENHGF